MKKLLQLLFVLIAISRCSSSNTPEQIIPSPTKAFTIEVYDRERTSHESVLTLRLLDQSGKELDYINTRVLEAARWAAIWENDSTILLGTEDTGARAWVVTKGMKFRETPVTDRLIRKGVSEVKKKYKQ